MPDALDYSRGVGIPELLLENSRGGKEPQKREDIAPRDLIVNDDDPCSILIHCEEQDAREGWPQGTALQLWLESQKTT